MPKTLSGRTLLHSIEWVGELQMSLKSAVSYLCAGGPSMMILIHKICIALSGLGNCSKVDKAMSDRAAMLLEKKKEKRRGVRLKCL